MLTRSKPLLVVADATTNISIPVKKNTISVTNLSRIFPAIHEFQPCGIVLDYDYIGNETEKVLRRLKSNPFYKDIKIYCFKSRPHTRVDDLLRVLGVQQFIYAEPAVQQQIAAAAKILDYVLDNVVASKLADAS